MKCVISALLLVLLASFVSSADISYTFEKPSGSLFPDSYITGTGANLFWGMSYGIRVTPEYTDLFSSSATTNNNTDLVYSFTSFPGALLFSPSSITFRVTVPSNVTTTIASNYDVVFSPASFLVRYTLVNMNASNNDPIWNFNSTAGTPVVSVDEAIAVQWTVQCYLAGTTTTCGTTAVSANITDFVETASRKKKKKPQIIIYVSLVIDLSSRAFY